MAATASEMDVNSMLKIAPFSHIIKKVQIMRMTMDSRLPKA
jgi:hypothetical protein